MDTEHLKSLEEIIRLFNEGGLSKMKVSLEGMSVELEKDGAPAIPAVPAEEPENRRRNRAH